MESLLVRHTGRYLIGCAALFLIASCGDKDSASGSAANCPGDQTYNKIIGQCVSPSSNNGNQQESDNGDGGSEENDDEIEIEPDPGPDCAEDADNDGDQLSNKCECELGTNQNKIDTDGDGLLDSEEDANQNCKVDRGETNPKKADMDQDGIPDGEEVEQGTDPLAPDTDGDGLDDGLETEISCLDPTGEDSDGDGLPDGVEDQNGDGKLGTCCEIGNCSSEDYSPSCANGDSNPCKKDTNGDGTPDSEDARFQTCQESDLENLQQPNLVTNVSGDYQLATEDSVKSSEVQGGSVEAHVFENKSLSYTGFVASFEPSSQTSDVSDLSQLVIQKTQQIYSSASQRSSGRRTTTYTNNKTVVGAIIDLPTESNLAAARDAILAELVGVDAGQIQHSLGSSLDGGTGSANPTLLVYQIVKRQNGAAIVGTFVPFEDYKNDSIKTGIHIDDLTGGGSLTKANQGLTGDCVSYEIKETPKVDIILSMDASQSMRDEQTRLENFSAKFTELLDEANVDWRIGVTSTRCNEIQEASSFPSAFRDLFPDSGGGVFGGGGVCSGSGNPFGGGGTANGKLVGGNFTTDPAKIARRIENVSDTNAEYTFTMAAAAAQRALPRSESDPTKLRPSANLVLIGVTDEEDTFFQRTLDFLPKGRLGGSSGLSQSEETKLNDAVKPWVDYLLQDKLQASVFGLYWPPGESCGSANSIGYAISKLVKETGGNGGSLCQSDITNTLTGIASATAGIASGLRLRGTPAPQSIKVKHADRSAQTTSELPRSRSNGFEYDSIVNRISFSGDDVPETDDRVVVPYLRWEGSVIRCRTDDDCPQAQKLQCIKGECR